METILAITLPFFALVLTGFWAGRRNFLTEAGITGLTRFVFYFALPAMLFVTLATSDITRDWNPAFIAAYLAASLVVFAAWAVVSRRVFAASFAEGAMMGLGAVYGNIGFMGIPLLVTALGAKAALPLALILTIDLIVIVPLGMLLVEVGEGSRAGVAHVLEAIWRTLTRNPLVIAIFAGLALSALDVGLFGPIEAFSRLLGGAAAPAAMFTLGAALSRRPVSEGIGEAAFMAAGKLVVHPLAVWAAMVAAGVSAFWMKTAVLGAAMPVAAALFVVAQQYGVLPGRTSTAILISTAVAMATLTALLVIF